ncbi:Putative pre-16S rRNA nuclease [Candidatus Ecksteinia adelgidicola]|nr:Putative pre-16S rRNA nuclease [Candidatus Ecksteinia adelgidicola]
MTAFKTNYHNTPNWKSIEKLLKEWKPDIIVVGLPLNMNGSDQIITKQVYYFSNQLYDRFGIEIVLHDERLTTIEARAYLFDQGGYRALKKNKIDAISAAIILKSWFNRIKD